MTDDQPSPAEALAEIQRSRRSVHDRVASGGWAYDLTYAALAAFIVGGQALEIPFNVSASTLGLLGLVALSRRESRRTGLNLTGVSPARARWVAIAIGLICAAIIIGLLIIRHTWPEIPAWRVGAVAAGIAFVVALIGSRIWRSVYRAEMRLDR